MSSRPPSCHPGPLPVILEPPLTVILERSEGSPAHHPTTLVPCDNPPNRRTGVTTSPRTRYGAGTHGGRAARLPPPSCHTITTRTPTNNPRRGRSRTALGAATTYPPSCHPEPSFMSSRAKPRDLKRSYDNHTRRVRWDVGARRGGRGARLPPPTRYTTTHPSPVVPG